MRLTSRNNGLFCSESLSGPHTLLYKPTQRFVFSQHDTFCSLPYYIVSMVGDGLFYARCNNSNCHCCCCCLSVAHRTSSSPHAPVVVVATTGSIKWGRLAIVPPLGRMCCDCVVAETLQTTRCTYGFWW